MKYIKYLRFTEMSDMKQHVVRKQRARSHCLLSIPKEFAKKINDVDYFRVDFDNGRLVFSPVEV